jgi:hypothetical protein
MSKLNAVSAEIIEKYRQTCLFYVKIDFGILTVLIAVLGLLKLEEFEVFSYIDELKVIIISVVLLLVCGLVFDRWLLYCWSKAKSSAVNAASSKWIHRGITLQLVLHIFVIAFLAAYALAYASGYTKSFKYGYAIGHIQADIELFKDEQGQFPENLQELAIQFPSVKGYLYELNPDWVRYSLDPERGYILRFAGSDGRFDTEDDDVEDHQTFSGR